MFWTQFGDKMWFGWCKSSSKLRDMTCPKKVSYFLATRVLLKFHSLEVTDWPCRLYIIQNRLCLLIPTGKATNMKRWLCAGSAHTYIDYAGAGKNGRALFFFLSFSLWIWVHGAYSVACPDATARCVIGVEYWGLYKYVLYNIAVRFKKKRWFVFVNSSSWVWSVDVPNRLF